jgi:hypothetical protein
MRLGAALLLGGSGLSRVPVLTVRSCLRDSLGADRGVDVLRYW